MLLTSNSFDFKVDALHCQVWFHKDGQFQLQNNLCLTTKCTLQLWVQVKLVPPWLPNAQWATPMHEICSRLQKGWICRPTSNKVRTTQGPHLTWKKQQVGWGTRLPYGQHKGVSVCLITQTLIGEFARSTERQTLRGWRWWWHRFTLWRETNYSDKNELNGDGYLIDYISDEHSCWLSWSW